VIDVCWGYPDLCRDVVTWSFSRYPEKRRWVTSLWIRPSSIHI